VSAGQPRRALVLADGESADRPALDRAWPGWDASIDLVVAADGGARLARELGLGIDRWVGDGDSLDVAEIEALRSENIAMDEVRPDKDESDTELALLAAIGSGATDVTILGALGGPRLDHALANVDLLAHPGIGDAEIRLLGGSSRVSIIVARPSAAENPESATGEPVTRRFAGAVGDLVSLLPLSETVRGVTTEGLRYALQDEPLLLGPARGLSNVRTGSIATISIRSGRLLVIDTTVSLVT
jgi:thiamine pyrophosphokinase